jgi:HD superfamily phosphodiesterase
MRTFAEYRIFFAPFYEAVRDGHEAAHVKNGAHGLDHDVTVAMLAVQIAPDERTADKAWCAAMLHSIDRQFGRWSTPEEKAAIDRQFAETMRTYLKELPEAFFSQEEVEEIFEAARRHSELNQQDQSLTQMVLMDADRLANLQMAVVLRAAAHQHHRPALELQYLGSVNPKSTYREPLSALDDLWWNLHEYLPQMRIPQAVALSKAYALRIRQFMDAVKSDYDDLGLTGVEL